jgi:phosphohistidine swiveling domain-containing protein
MYAYNVPRPDHFPNLHLAAADSWRGITANLQGEPYLVVDKRGNQYILEGENGERFSATDFDWFYGVDAANDALVSASRMEGSPFCRIGKLFYDGERWNVVVEGRKLKVEAAFDYLEDHAWYKTALRKLALAGWFAHHITGKDVQFTEEDHFPADQAAKEYWLVRGDDGQKYYITHDGIVYDQSDEQVGEFDPYENPYDTSDDYEPGFYEDYDPSLDDKEANQLGDISQYVTDAKTHLQNSGGDPTRALQAFQQANPDIPQDQVWNIINQAMQQQQGIQQQDGNAGYQNFSKTAGLTLQGPPAGAPKAGTGVCIHMDKQSLEEINAEVAKIEEINNLNPEDVARKMMDHDNQAKGLGPVRDPYNHPLINRGGGVEKEALDMAQIDQSLRAAEQGFVIAKAWFSPDDSWLMYHKNCVGLITEVGGTTAHAIVVANERDVPCVLNIEVDKLNPGDIVTVDGKKGIVTVGTGDAGFEESDAPLKAKVPVARFVWQNGNPETANVDPNNTEANGHFELLNKLDERVGVDYEAEVAGGTVYEGGEAEQFGFNGGEIADQAALEEWLRATFQVENIKHIQFNQVQAKVAANKYDAGQRIQIEHQKYKGQRGTITQFNSKDKNFDEETYDVLLDNGETLEGVSESNFKKIKSAGFDPAEHDTASHFFLETQEIVEAARSDYDHYNEEADRMWWEEEGKHPESEPDFDSPDMEARDAQWEQIIEEARDIMWSDPEITDDEVMNQVNLSGLSERDINSVRSQLGDIRYEIGQDNQRIPYGDPRWGPEEEAGLMDDEERQRFFGSSRPGDNDPLGPAAPSRPGTYDPLATAQTCAGCGGSVLNGTCTQCGEVANSDFVPQPTGLIASWKVEADYEWVDELDLELEDKTARSHFTPSAQRELIEENMGARARNYEKLNLDGTHYPEDRDENPFDQFFLW